MKKLINIYHKNNQYKMKKLENLLDFEDFKANWKEKEFKKTKRTEIGLDIIEENNTTDIKDENCPFRKK